MSVSRSVGMVLCITHVLIGGVAAAGPGRSSAPADESDPSALTPPSTPPPRANRRKRKPKPAPSPPPAPDAPSPSVDTDPGSPHENTEEALSPSAANSESPSTALPAKADAGKETAPSPEVHAAAGASRETKPAEATTTPAAVAAAATALSTSTLKIGGSAILWYYQPFDVAGIRDDIEIYDTRLTVEADWGMFGFFFEPHFRDSRLRPYYDGPVWVQQAYGYLDLDTAIVKIGKIYSHLGLFWDNSFYGNIEGYDGLKLSPEYGASVEGTLGHDFGARYWLQFFPVDGRTNISLPDRDTISVPGARRRNEAVVRFEPFAKLGENSELAVALSGEYFLADFTDDQEDVVRLAVDAKLTVGGLGIWGELARQEGRSVTDFPLEPEPAAGANPAVPGRASAHNDYLLTGAEYTEGKWTGRGNFSIGNYEDVSVLEWLFVPGIGYAVTDHMTLLGEFALWERNVSGTASVIDRSFNLSLSVWF